MKVRLFVRVRLYLSRVERWEVEEAMSVEAHQGSPHCGVIHDAQCVGILMMLHDLPQPVPLLEE